ncbi:unnamed protein product [Paramecium octaurelia]|uniref:Uncharacterized protein n=1 Tax=Paramecium octaurelia TaxID=43137 RepID=A0A8S1SMX4_PAROT|nr:unnamed protein product [Paramecium octaurelia]
MNKQQCNYHYSFKFIIVGNSGVGKSCLLQQFIEGQFKNNIDSTVGIGFGQKDMIYKDSVIRINVWDTAGQESFRSITRAYYRGSIACLLVYDVTKKKTFHHLINWLNEVKQDSSAEIMIVGNKIDSWGREVSQDEGQQLAQQTGCLYLETSARTGENVIQAFETLVQRIYMKIKNKEIDLNDPQNGIKLGEMSEAQPVINQYNGNQNSSCC